MTRPLTRYPWVTRKRALVVFGAATLGFTITLYLLDPHVQGHWASISDFEFAGSSSRAAQIMAEWGTEGRRLAHLGLLLDYGYMLSYGLFFALARFAVRDAVRGWGWRRMAKAGRIVPWFARCLLRRGRKRRPAVDARRPRRQLRAAVRNCPGSAPPTDQSSA